jgi:hypothetical protein
MGRYAYSIWPVVSFIPWFRRFDCNRVIISMINRMMANHACLRSHLGRIGIVKSLMCVCSRDYETVDHVLWDARDFTPKSRNSGWTGVGSTNQEHLGERD